MHAYIHKLFIREKKSTWVAIEKYHEWIIVKNAHELVFSFTVREAMPLITNYVRV